MEVLKVVEVTYLYNFDGLRISMKKTRKLLAKDINHGLELFAKHITSNKDKDFKGVVSVKVIDSVENYLTF